jgi:hypothetical protein
MGYDKTEQLRCRANHARKATVQAYRGKFIGDCTKQIRRDRARPSVLPVYRLWPASVAKSVVGFLEMRYWRALQKKSCRVIVRVVTMGAATAILCYPHLVTDLGEIRYERSAH